AQPEEIIRRDAGFRKTAKIAERLRAKERRRRTEVEQSAAEELPLERQRRRQEHRTRSAGPVLAAGQRERGARLGVERPDHRREAVRVHDVVGVVEFQEAARGERSDLTAVAVVAEIAWIDDDANARVSARVLLRDLHGAIG